MRSGDEKADLDIFALIKMNMSDSMLCQTPLLVYPGSLIEDVERFLNEVNRTDKTVVAELESERAQDLRDMADAIQVDYPHMSRAVSFYRQMLNPTSVKG